MTKTTDQMAKEITLKTETALERREKQDNRRSGEAHDCGTAAVKTGVPIRIKCKATR